MGNEFTTIGGIKYSSDQVSSFTRDGNSFTVTLIDGSVFNYRDQKFFGGNGKMPTIIGANMNENDKGHKDITISNCRLTNVSGTNKTDVLIFNDTKVRDINIGGDPNNSDMLIFYGTSSVEHPITNYDDNDIIIDKRETK